MKPHCLPYAGIVPRLAGAPRAALAGHALVGRVTLGRDAWLGVGSVIRADGHFVDAGDDLHLGRGATVHIAHERQPTRIGRAVSVGANAVVHACDVGDDAVIEEDCVILDGSTVGAACLLEAGSIVFPRGELCAGWLHAGTPAQPVRELAPGELAERRAALRARNEAASRDWPGAVASLGDDVFVADSARLAGRVAAAAGASIWYGCRLDARRGTIVLGAQANVQDNSVLVAGEGDLSIGEGSTIGHNVELASCTIGARSLVGIGSRIAPGSVIADDAFVAAGARTTPGQVLEGGFVWAGAPARKLGSLDERKREIVRITAEVYAGYGRAMRHAVPA